MELLDKKQNPKFRKNLLKYGSCVELEDFDFARFSYLGFPCIVRRNHYLGNWCGYVGVGKSHPFFGIKFVSRTLNNIRVHGGITYSEPCMDDECLGVCHPNNGNDERFWFGFDCAHAYDTIPVTFTKPPLIMDKDEYRDANYVINECKNLAEQFYNIEHQG